MERLAEADVTALRRTAAPPGERHPRSSGERLRAAGGA